MLNEIKLKQESKHTKKRVGRGMASGTGKTCGRGHKGQKSRTGGKVQVGFEGGQMPLQRRVPKFGFRSPNRIETRPINLDTIQQICETTKVKEINPEFLIKNGLARKSDLIKVLGRGKLKAKVNVTAHYFSATAAKAVEKAGGKIKKLINE